MPKKRLAWGALLTLSAGLLLVTLRLPRPLLDPALAPTAAYLAHDPPRRPDFILFYSTHVSWINHFKQAIFVTISQAPFARPGILADQLSRHLRRYSSARIDGYIVKTEKMGYDTRTCEGLGENIDTSAAKCWGGEILVNMDVGGFRPGLHVADVTVFDLDGLKHTFTWSFRIPENRTISEPVDAQTSFISPATATR